MALSRRSFLVGGTVALAGAAGFRSVYEPRTTSTHRGTFGPLRPDPNGILDLPEGFRYRVLDRVGTPMSDGHPVPGLPDGMHCFTLPDGKFALMRNHELPGLYDAPFAGEAPPEAYRKTMTGGVTRVVVDPQTFERVSSNLVLTGTSRNCAGGASPWGWLSCEESLAPEHGYVFLCDIEADRVAPPRKLPGYGRMHHEAAVIDPATSIAYLTEDQGDGCLYRFVPSSPEQPFEGTLQALRVRGKPRLQTGSGMTIADRAEVDWVDVRDVDPSDDDTATRHQAQAEGAALFVRGEGIAFANGAVTFCATTGGAAGKGQVFRLEPEGDRGSLTVLAESYGGVLNCPDNVTVSPWGEVYVAEDPMARPYLCGITDSGEAFHFARNALSLSELAGVCFSPDGRAMFVNLQHDGLTLAITGPFPGTVG